MLVNMGEMHSYFTGPSSVSLRGIFLFSCSCSMLLLSFQLVLLKETHSPTPTMPRGVRVMVLGRQGLYGGLPIDDRAGGGFNPLDCGDRKGGGSGSKQ